MSFHRGRASARCDLACGMCPVRPSKGPSLRRSPILLNLSLGGGKRRDGAANCRRRADELQGKYGIRRYLGDSYWTADYKDKLPPEKRTADVSELQEERDALARSGEEAQWCIFDPVVSVIAGRRFLCTGDTADLERQVHYLNRSLGQITGPDCPQGELRCPEAYYLEGGRYVPNDHVPLLSAKLTSGLLCRQWRKARPEHVDSIDSASWG